MKNLLSVLFIVIIILIGLGYFIENTTENNGKLYIGIGVALFAFILMPLFVYKRYNNRIGDFIDKRMEKPTDSTDQKQ